MVEDLMVGEYESPRSKEVDDVSNVKAAPAKKDKKAAKKANSKADDSDEEGSSFDDSSHSDDEKEDVSKVKAAPAKKDKKPKKKLGAVFQKFTAAAGAALGRRDAAKREYEEFEDEEF